MARFLKPLVRSGGYYPSRRWTPLVYPGGYTTANDGEEPAPQPIEKTITGNPIHILDALAKPAQALSVALEPIQNLNGYDNPWPAGGGVNKFDESVFSNYGGVLQTSGVWHFDSLINILNKVLWTAPESIGQITVTMWRKQGGAGSQGLRLAINYTDGTSVKVGNYGATGGTDVYSVTTDASKTVRNITGDYGSNQNSTDVNVVVSIGSTAPSAYSPYSNICPISGWTGAQVVRTGINIFDKTAAVQDAFISDTNGIETVRTGSVCSGYISVVPNTTYYIKSDQTKGAWGAWYDENKTYISGITGYITSAQDSAKTKTAPSNARYMRLTIVYAGSGNLDTFSVNYPSTDHDHHAYTGNNTYSVSWETEAGTVYGGTLDVTSGVLTVDRAIVDMGTLNWMYYSAQRRIVAQVNSGKPAGTNVGLDGACSVYKVVNTAYRQAPDKSIVIGNNFISNSYAAMVVRDENYTDAETFKTAVSGQTLVFPLKNPVTYQLTPTEVTTLPGTNNIWADAGDVTVTYLADGNASDAEALGILLGGRYTPSDDVTDKEALDIILGGTK